MMQDDHKKPEGRNPVFGRQWSNRQKTDLEVATMKMDRIRDDQVGGTVMVQQFGDKVREVMLRWLMGDGKYMLEMTKSSQAGLEADDTH